MIGNCIIILFRRLYYITGLPWNTGELKPTALCNFLEELQVNLLGYIGLILRQQGQRILTLLLSPKLLHVALQLLNP